jgi:hypothetical protein
LGAHEAEPDIEAVAEPSPDSVSTDCDANEFAISDAGVVAHEPVSVAVTMGVRGRLLL